MNEKKNRWQMLQADTRKLSLPITQSLGVN